MMHNTHILNNTTSNEYFTFDEFYEIVTKKKYWLHASSIYYLI